MLSSSKSWSNRDERYNSSNFLRENPTTTSPPPSNAAVVDTPVDDETRRPQPTITAAHMARLQEWNDFKADFDDFLIGFVKFRNKVLPPGTTANDASTRRVDDNDDRTLTACGSASFRRVIGELEQVNQQFSQLLDQLENQAPSMHPITAIINNLQQPVQTPPCVEEVEPTALLDPAHTPAPQTALLGESPWDSQSQPTTIHTATTMVESDRTFVILPPPAPDPVDMVYTRTLWPTTGVLWPQPRLAWKLVPFKKKPKTKHTFVRRRDQDLRPP